MEVLWWVSKVIDVVFCGAVIAYVMKRWNR